MLFESDEELDYEEGDEIIENEVSKVSKENMDVSDGDDNFLEIKVNKKENHRFAKERKGTEKEEKTMLGKKDEKEIRRKVKGVKEMTSNRNKEFSKKVYSNKKSEFCHRLPKRHQNKFKGSGYGSCNSSRFQKGNLMNKSFRYTNQPFLNSCGYLSNNQMNLPLRQNISSEQLSSFWSRPNLLHQNNFSNFQENLMKLDTLFPTVSVPQLQLAARFPTIQPQLRISYDQPLPTVNNHYETDLNLLFKNVKKTNPFDKQETAALSAPSGLFNNLESLRTNYSQPNQHPITSINTEMEESEKNMITIKKQARLQRFMNEDGFLIPKNDNDPQKKVIINRGNFFPQNINTIVVENDSQIGKTLNETEKQTTRITTPTFRKEILNKKQNPFETRELNSVQIKKEKADEYQSELSFAKTAMPDLSKTGIRGVETNQERMLNCSDRSNLSCNNENNTKVTFVRTISKSFDELGLSKPLLENRTQTQKILSTPQTKLTTSFLEESILTGCIVKVLNISKNTTTNDILEMCNPVGRVLEIKLNVPKENSAVIRFAESGSAEDFYALYHGQKYCDNFLNVIIV